MSDNDAKIDYIEFPGTDLGALKSFYGEVFRWEFTDYGPAYTSFQDGRLAGGFQTQEESSGALIVIFAQDLEDTLSKVEAAGGEIVKPIFSFPGGRRFHFRDPSGNELAVWSDR